MSSCNPQAPARLATEIGIKYGLRCKYEYDRRKRTFVYRFFRHGCFIGATADPTKVVSLMEKYACASSEK